MVVVVVVVKAYLWFVNKRSKVMGDHANTLFVSSALAPGSSPVVTADILEAGAARRLHQDQPQGIDYPRIPPLLVSSPLRQLSRSHNQQDWVRHPPLSKILVLPGYPAPNQGPVLIYLSPPLKSLCILPVIPCTYNLLLLRHLRHLTTSSPQVRRRRHQPSSSLKMIGHGEMATRNRKMFRVRQTLHILQHRG